MARREVAGFDGVSARVALGASLFAGASTIDFSGEFTTGSDITSNQAVVGEMYLIEHGVKISGGNAILRLKIGGVDHLASTAVSVSTTYNFRFLYTGSNLTIELDGIEVLNESASGSIDDGSGHFCAGSYCQNTGGTGWYFTGELWDVNVITDSTSLRWTLEGSTYDVSGNGNHGTNNGADLTATYTDITDGVYSYNLQKGYGYKIDGITLVPRLEDNSDWADTGVVDERLSGFWHNEAEAWINFPDTFTDDIWDKSDTAIWKDAVRASIYYDSGNVRLWHPSELTLDYLSSQIKSGGARTAIPEFNSPVWNIGEQALYSGVSSGYLLYSISPSVSANGLSWIGKIKLTNENQIDFWGFGGTTYIARMRSSASGKKVEFYFTDSGGTTTYTSAFSYTLNTEFYFSVDISSDLVTVGFGATEGTIAADANITNKAISSDVTTAITNLIPRAGNEGYLYKLTVTKDSLDFFDLGYEAPSFVNLAEEIPDESNRLFCWDTESEWVKNGDYYKSGDRYVYAVTGDLTRMQNLLAYDTRIEDPALIKTVKYLDKKGGAE